MEEKEEEEEEKEESLTIEFSGMGSRGESWNNFISISLGGGETLRLRLAVQVGLFPRPNDAETRRYCIELHLDAGKARHCDWDCNC